ncbi:MAG: GNAT family N-acetyltransferase, partial [Lachnospiraceae bacterium]|nr:GNAT family N-acetyltransferase [Lachnospiraceae bacterium]
MTIKDVPFRLKDGREALLRSPKEEDIESTLEYLVLSAGETEYILRYPEECSKYTVESEKMLFEQKNKSPNEAMIMCIVDGKVVGNCDITFFKNLKTRHRASVG